MEAKLSKLLKKPFIKVSLPKSFSESLFLLESKCIQTPTTDIINSLFNLYALGIEYYTNISNKTIANVYQSKMLFISSLIDNEKNHKNKSESEAPPPSKVIEIKKNHDEMKEEIFNTFHDSLYAFTNLVNQSLEMQANSMEHHKSLMSRTNTRRNSQNKKKIITKVLPLLKSIFGNRENSNSIRRMSVAPNLIMKKSTFKREKAIDLFELDNKLNKITLYCNQKYLNKMKAFIEECTRINKIKNQKYEKYYSVYKELEILQSDNNCSNKEGIQEMIKELQSENNEEITEMDESNKIILQDYSEIEPDSNWDTKEINEINRKIFKDITNIILIN